MNEELLQYHPSYTDEENQIVHEFIENASEEELVEQIKKLQELYEKEVPGIHKSLMQLKKEIRERDMLNQKYEALKERKNEWSKYITALTHYKDALIIRKKYADFKKIYKHKSVFLSFLLEHEKDKDMVGLNRDFIQKAVLSEKAKDYIGKPQAPYIYSSVDEIKVNPLNDDESLERIGKDNLKYMVKMMLYDIDSPNASTVPAYILFLTRNYSKGKHRKSDNLPLFTTNLLSTPELYEENLRLLNEINEKKIESEELLAEIEKNE